MSGRLDSGVGIGLRPMGEILRRAREGSLFHVLPGWVFDPVAISIVSPPARMKLARVKAVADALARAARQLG